MTQMQTVKLSAKNAFFADRVVDDKDEDEDEDGHIVCGCINASSAGRVNED